jgi:hypothetical protein
MELRWSLDTINYTSDEFSNYLRECKIRRQLTTCVFVYRSNWICNYWNNCWRLKWWIKTIGRIPRNFLLISSPSLYWKVSIPTTVLSTNEFRAGLTNLTLKGVVHSSDHILEPLLIKCLKIIEMPWLTCWNYYDRFIW